MRADAAIRVEHVSKQFRLGRVQNEYPTLREAIGAGVARAARSVASLGRNGRIGRAQPEMVRALDDVSFEVDRGEIVGLIGANGAGKSTLLKILSRITEPTSGRAEVRGRLGSLLEVGTGFHLELTGRENVFLSGAILGMRRAEIRRRFDEIVAFAEVERFIDTPVKFYSSGMYLRLAFAVAAHLEPEILLVDEVLAVGDASFQQKCLGKMDDVARQGRTILFVSHNMVAIESLCERVLWLDRGRLMRDGAAADVIGAYTGSNARTYTEQGWTDPDRAPGNASARMYRAAVRPEGGTPEDAITVSTPVVLEFEYWACHEGALVPSLLVTNEQGVVAFNVGPDERDVWHERAGRRGLFRDSCFIPGNLLNDGVYRVTFSLLDGHDVVYTHPDILAFEVRDRVEVREGWYGKWAGVVRPILEWRTEALPDQAKSPHTLPEDAS